MIPMPLRDVAVLTSGSLHPSSTAGDVLVDGSVVTDSRAAGPGSLYVARVGEHADGHAYVGAARERGAVAALTSRVVDDLPCVVVDDVQTAFGRLARGVVDRATDPHGRRRDRLVRQDVDQGPARPGPRRRG